MTQTMAAETRVNPGTGYFPAVDGLRALAVLTVMAFHLNEAVLPGGYVGVDIFFVISGFVVTASIAHERFASLPQLLVHFYSRRVARILPALFACLIVTSIAYCLFVPTAWLSSTIDDTGKWAFFGVSNIVLAHSDNYFSPKAAFNPFTHTWSLGVEEQFYLLFPFLMFFGQGQGRGRRWLAPVILALCAASLAASAYLTPRHWEEAFYLLPSRYWELGLGMALCLTMEHWRPWIERSARGALALTLLGAALIGCAVAIPTTVTFPFPWALLPALGSVALIASAVAQPKGILISAFAWAPIVFIGQISYALYLWHWPIDVLMRWTLGLNTWATWLGATIGAFALAIPTYYLIERPVRRLRQNGRVPAYVMVGVGVAVACVLGYATTKMLHNKTLISLSSTRNAALWYPTTISPATSACDILDQNHMEGAANVRVFTPNRCAAPKTQGRLIVAGDSHAIAYTRLLANYARESGREVKLYTIPGCRLVGLLPEVSDTDCTRAQLKVAQALGAGTGPNDIIFLPSLRTPRYADQSGGVRTGGAAPAEDEGVVIRWTEDGNPMPLVSAMLSGGARIVFEGPKPVFKAPPFRCGDWFNEGNPDCVGGLSIEKTELEARRAPPLVIMRKMAEENPRISVWDPFPLLCPGARCEAFRDGKPLFFDGDHMSGNTNDILLPHFSAMIEQKFADQTAH